MDSLPQDLLIGVSPLVFAVSTLASEGDSESPRRSLFDRFLDAVAASLVDDGPLDGNDSLESRRNSLSLFRTDDESSDEEDYELFGSVSGSQKRKNTALSSGFYAGFGRRAVTTSASSDLPTDSPPSHAKNKAVSYAKALQNGQGFFQRARIVSVSTHHGLPPCKDPEGTDNLASSLAPFLKNRDPKLGKLLIDNYPLNGIITAGWLEKHVHALPSVILVVCTVCSNQKEQDLVDKRLLETISNFEVSMVPKRHCTIHVVGLMTDDVTILQGEEWTRAISAMIMDEESGASDWFRVALLRASSDLEASDTGLPTSQALRELHQSVRDASMQYYLGQARRTKEKLRNLTLDKHGHGQDLPPCPILPLVIRYCFKIAIFYEFQWKHEKSLRFMTEAYRHATRYYEYLLHLRCHPDEIGNERGPDSAHSISVTGDELEISLNNASTMNLVDLWNQIIPSPTEDMVHQCRAVAEWLNLKLLQAGFSSHTEGGLLAADSQWRQHCRLFCSRRHVPLSEDSDWFEWAYIARNWKTMSELVERHPPKALGDLGNDYDEVLLRCSPWRCYEATADATLYLWRALESTRRRGEHMEPCDNDDPMRARYIGSFGSCDLGPVFSELLRVNGRAKALDLALRAIALYEAECEKDKRGFYAEDHAKERSTSRAGVRLYYSVGSILLGMGRHQDAAVYLEKATRFASGWPGLELAIRRMLIECYEEHIPSSADSCDETNQALVSMILDSYFNAKMSTQSLRRALDHFASMAGGGGYLNWYRESEDEEDKSLPFSFAVSFPDRTHATAGDSVKASVLITSNLDYAVHVNSAILLSLAGELAIPTVDLLSAENASEGHQSGIIIQSKTSIIISTVVELPKDTSSIAVDESGNGGEIQGVAGKGSFAKSARPRSAGVTSAGGARLVSEVVNSLDNRITQGWSLRYLGGKSLRCDGLRLTFYPVQVEKAVGGEAVTFIKLTLRKKKPKTPANIKRTPFEEDNYIASAWSRPAHLPLLSGPRSLRVLGPQPELLVQDITQNATDGKALEGTVNRIILKLTAGTNERCVNIQCRVSCFSVLVTAGGSTIRLVPKEDVVDGDGTMAMNNHLVRTPCLVSASPGGLRANQVAESPFGYPLPSGWEVAESGSALTTPTISYLERSQSTFIQLALFRPPPSAALEDNDMRYGDGSICKTDFYVNISYEKERQSVVATKRIDMRAASRRRARPVMSTQHKLDTNDLERASGTREDAADSSPEAPGFDEVNLEYTGSIVWSPPMSVTYDCGPALSGQRHTPTASADNLLQASLPVLRDGDIVATRCTLKAYDQSSPVATEIVGIRIQPNDTDDVKTTLVSQEDPEATDVVHLVDPKDPCRTLKDGSQMSFAYLTQPRLKPPGRQTGASVSLGRVTVEWKPTLVPVPDEAMPFFKDQNIFAHGPLRLSSPSHICFSGPRCLIERAPIEARRLPLKSAPLMNQPFHIQLMIANNSQNEDIVEVCVCLDSDSAIRDRLVFSGMLQGVVSLAPSEELLLSFTFIALSAGEVELPQMKLASARSRSSVADIPSQRINVLPSEPDESSGVVVDGVSA